MERAGELVMIFIAVVVVVIAEVRLCWAGIFLRCATRDNGGPGKRRPV